MCMQRGGVDRRDVYLGVGPTFYTSLLDGGGVVSLGVHRVAEARGGVSMRWVKTWVSFSTWGRGATRPVL